MKRDDFELQWQRRQQALKNAKAKMPTDEWMLGVARRAMAAGNETKKPQRHRFRWIPYAAVAGLLVTVSIIGLRHKDNVTQLPVTEKVDVEGLTIRFLCNSGCSADDVVQSAYSIMIQ